MDHSITVVERAFQLAKSGECNSVPDIRKRLKAEGYPLQQIVGRSLSRQLEAIIRTARGKRYA